MIAKADHALPRVSVVLCTYRRNRQLQLLLNDLRQQTHPPDEVVVVDNQAHGPAAAVVQAFRASQPPFLVHYGIEPQQNIALARNLSFSLSSSELIVCLDDDERIRSEWLETLLHCQQHTQADCLLGPVLYSFRPGVPAWKKGNYIFANHSQATGLAVPYERLRFGNVLLRRDALTPLTGPFNPAFGLTGGEDGDMLCRLRAAGGSIVWCNEAEVVEPVGRERTRVRWLLLRALRSGQDYTRHWQQGYYGSVSPLRGAVFLLRALVQTLIAAVLAPLSLPWGIDKAADWALRSAANIGKLTAWFGWYYREYESTITSR